MTEGLWEAPLALSYSGWPAEDTGAAALRWSGRAASITQPANPTESRFGPGLASGWLGPCVGCSLHGGKMESHPGQQHHNSIDACGDAKGQGVVVVSAVFGAGSGVRGRAFLNEPGNIQLEREYVRSMLYSTSALRLGSTFGTRREEDNTALCEAQKDAALHNLVAQGSLLEINSL